MDPLRKKRATSGWKRRNAESSLEAEEVAMNIHAVGVGRADDGGGRRGLGDRGQTVPDSGLLPVLESLLLGNRSTPE
jgi:hypothetical protein